MFIHAVCLFMLFDLITHCRCSFVVAELTSTVLYSTRVRSTVAQIRRCAGSWISEVVAEKHHYMSACSKQHPFTPISPKECSKYIRNSSTIFTLTTNFTVKKLHHVRSFIHFLSANEGFLAVLGKGKGKGKGKCIAVCETSPTPLREITYHMGSHSVTCHTAEVTFPPLPQPKLVIDLATPKGCKAELT